MSSTGDESEGGEGLPFAHFTLDGERFRGGRLPIDAMIELERYRKILLASAERAWHRENPGQELPEDFASEFDLSLGEILTGSVTTIFDRRPSIYDAYFDDGREATERAFAEIVAGLNLDEYGDTSQGGPEADSPGSDDEAPIVVGWQTTHEELVELLRLPAFQELGANLHSDEVVKIPAPDSTQTEISASVRAQTIRPLVERAEALAGADLVDAGEKITHHSDSVAGRLVGLNADKKNYTLSTLHYGVVNGRYRDESMLDELKAVLNASSLAPVVRITGRMSWRGEQLRSILEATKVELFEVEGEPWSRRLLELASLPRRWAEDGRSGQLISFASLDAAREILRSTASLAGPTPGIFPLEDGGLQIEWPSAGKLTSVEVSPDAALLVHSLRLEPRAVSAIETQNLEEATAMLLEALQ